MMQPGGSRRGDGPQASVPRLYWTRQPEHSSGVDEKRSKWSRSTLTTWSASAFAASKSPQSNKPDQTTFEPASSWRIGAPSASAASPSTSAGSGSYSTPTSPAASRATPPPPAPAPPAPPPPL